MECGLHEIRIDFGVNDSPTSVTQLISRLATVANVSSGRVQIDVSRSQYLGPDAASVLLAFVKMWRSRGAEVDVQLPSFPEALRAFCVFSGLTWELKHSDWPDPSHPLCVTVPLRTHTEARFADVEAVSRLIRAYVHFSDQRASALEVAFSEVLQNVEDHAASPVGAVSCARFLRHRHEVRVAIVDMGCGIASTLRTRHPEFDDDAQAIRATLQGGFSSMSRRNNAGQGLSNLRLCVARPGGKLFIISERASASINSRNELITRSLPFRFQGTGVFFTLPTR
jgi:hypothetical protein